MQQSPMVARLAIQTNMMLVKTPVIEPVLVKLAPEMS